MLRTLMLAACAAFVLTQAAQAVEVTETVTTSASPKPSGNSSANSRTS